MANVLTQLKDIWTRMPISGRVMTVGAGVLALGLIGASIYYGSQPDYGVLFTDLKPADAQSIVEKLKAANVPYTLTNNGTTVQVPNERVAELRLQMASEGALSGGHVGFDLFDKTSFGATDFAQQINYRRAIEGELSKTLEGMDEIEGARVHITPKKESVFSEKEEGAKASIMVRVKQNKELSGERADAIVALIASSVDGLDPSNVSVMDTRGRLLVAAGHNKSGAVSDAGAFQAQQEAKQKFESESVARIISMLEPVVGEDRVRADISADIDFSQVEQSEEKYNPQSQVVRSQQTSTEARNSNAPVAAGVAGARSNNPATLPSPTPPPTNPASGDQRSASTVNYEIDKTVKKTIGGGGRINRMTVSVVVDNKMVEGVEVARTTDEVTKIQELVGAAVGIDPNRGDSVVVQTMPFAKPQIDPAAPQSFLEKNKALIPNLTKYGTLVLITILVLLFVVRPARKAWKAALASSEEQKLLAAAVAEQEENDPLPGEQRLIEQMAQSENPEMITVAELEAQMASANGEAGREAERVENLRKQIAAQTINDTETVASTLRGWLREGV